MFTAAFSPDGTRIVTAGKDDTARVWDLAFAKPVRAIAVGQNETLIGLEIVDEMDSVKDMRAMARAKWESRAKHIETAPPDPPEPADPVQGS